LISFGLSAFQLFNRGKGFTVCVFDVAGEINFRPGQMGDVFVAEFSGVNQFSQHVIIRAKCPFPVLRLCVSWINSGKSAGDLLKKPAVST
jgi:hypothetical protein